MLRARGRSVATVWVPAAVSGIEDSLREMRAAPKEPSVVSRGPLTASFAIRNPWRVARGRLRQKIARVYLPSAR